MILTHDDQKTTSSWLHCGSEIGCSASSCSSGLSEVFLVRGSSLIEVSDALESGIPLEVPDAENALSLLKLDSGVSLIVLIGPG